MHAHWDTWILVCERCSLWRWHCLIIWLDLMRGRQEVGNRADLSAGDAVFVRGPGMREVDGI